MASTATQPGQLVACTKRDADGTEQVEYVHVDEFVEFATELLSSEMLSRHPFVSIDIAERYVFDFANGTLIFCLRSIHDFGRIGTLELVEVTI
jgi:hypothetical protein